MKLYYKPGACSLASHIALREIGGSFDLEKVDTKTKKTESGEDYLTVNPNGYVPALKFDNGDVLTEGPAILQYLADANPGVGLAAESGTLDRARTQSYLNFVGTELHNAFSPLFSDTIDDAGRGKAKANVAKRMDYIENELSDGRNYLVDNKFSVADAYLFVVANWSGHVGIDLKQWPNVTNFVKRVAARPAAQEALRAEGLIN